LPIANPCFVLFVHVHKAVQNNLAIRPYGPNGKIREKINANPLNAHEPRRLGNLTLPTSSTESQDIFILHDAQFLIVTFYPVV
jgi:hypothetical protein